VIRVYDSDVNNPPKRAKNQGADVMKPTAMVVDDDRDLLDMTASLLERHEVKVVAKDSAGESALQHLREYRPDLAIIK
jgi:CheY-like chemotaxis protein